MQQAAPSAVNPSQLPTNVYLSELSGPVEGALLRIGDTALLLNCGDPSPASPSVITSMSSIGIPSGTILTAILLTDWRMSSCGMLSAFLSVYNTHHNRKSKEKIKPPIILCTYGTRMMLPHILRECKHKDINLSFLSDSTQATISCVALKQPFVHPGCRLTVTPHRAGHVAGGCMYTINMDGIQVWIRRHVPIF
jgi:Cft2 family RNA processing exonuclease